LLRLSYAAKGILVGHTADLATSAMIDAWGGLVYGLALTSTGSREDADDVYQEVFLTYHQKQPQCQDDEHRKAWLIRTTLIISKRVKVGRGARAVPTDPKDIEHLGGEPVRFSDAGQERLFAAMLRLSEEDRAIVHLRYIAGFQAKEIAAALGITAIAARKRLERARASLRQFLEET
jgi:RNA polymerase sigma-70 factor (ECF subfamily)